MNICSLAIEHMFMTTGAGVCIKSKQCFTSFLFPITHKKKITPPKRGRDVVKVDQRTVT